MGFRKIMSKAELYNRSIVVIKEYINIYAKRLLNYVKMISYFEPTYAKLFAHY